MNWLSRQTSAALAVLLKQRVCVAFGLPGLRDRASLDRVPERVDCAAAQRICAVGGDWSFIQHVSGQMDADSTVIDAPLDQLPRHLLPRAGGLVGSARV